MNQCVCRFFGILLVVVIYTAFTVEGVGYGVDCSGGESCDDANTECPSSGTKECACIATYYRKSDDSACALIVTTLSGVCDIADTAAEQCSYANTECTADGGGGKCLCIATHYSDGTDCQTKIAFGVDCSGGKECAGDNTACPSSGTLVCGCAATYYRKSDDSACALIVPDLSGTCDVADTASEQCSKADTECTADGGGGKCLCKDTHFSDGTDCQTRIGFGVACSNTVTATNQCDLVGTECSLESGTSDYKCQCSADYYASGSNTCVARIAPGNSCSANQCVEHASCNTNCECDAGYTASPTTNPTMCSGVVKFASLSYMYVVPILISLMSLLR